MSASHLLTPIEQYTSYGNRRPHAGELTGMLDRLLMGWSNVPSALVYAADMCIDLSLRDQSNSESWLSKSRQMLNDIAAASERSLQDRSRQNHSAVSALTTARMRLSELKYWGKASANQPLTSNYKAARRVARNTLPLIPKDPHIKDRLKEFVPILLGERARDHGISDGWFGRIALTREDSSLRLAKGLNGNWDTGLSFSDSPSHFISPELKLQIKSGRAKHAKEYAAAHIPVLSARNYGFNNVSSIILGCCLEAGDDLPASVVNQHIDPLSSGELDAITASLEDNFHHLSIPSRLGHGEH